MRLDSQCILCLLKRHSETAAACGNEESGLYVFAADGAGKIVVGEAGGHDLQFALILWLRIL